MTSTTSAQGKNPVRTYYRANSAVFLKTKEKYGGFSNMAGGFPLVVNGIEIRTSEALYQACRFPHMPEIQQLIIEQKSPMAAKMKGKPHRHNSRADWDAVRVQIMRWCLQVKLAQNWDSFSKLLLETADLPIVEQSRQDDFWGAKPVDRDTLTGVNVLGRLLMELREQVKDYPSELLLRVQPLPIQDFLLNGRQIEVVDAARVIGNNETLIEAPPPQGEVEVLIKYMEQPPVKKPGTSEQLTFKEMVMALKDREGLYIFASSKQRYPKNTKPIRLMIDGHINEPFKHWKDVIHQVVSWLVDEHLLGVSDCPIMAGRWVFIDCKKTGFTNPRDLPNGLFLHRGGSKGGPTTEEQWYRLRKLLGDHPVDLSAIQVRYEAR